MADAGQTAADVAHTVPFKEGQYFTPTRKRVRTALNEHGVADEIDRLTPHIPKSRHRGDGRLPLFRPPEKRLGGGSVHPYKAPLSSQILPLPLSYPPPLSGEG